MKDDKIYTVYQHTSPDNKLYIGVTFNDLETRWKNGFGYQNNTPFFIDIVKYGWDNFKHEILFTNLTKRQAECVEKILIGYYKADNFDYGYNKNSGGVGRPLGARNKPHYKKPGRKARPVVAIDKDNYDIIYRFQTMTEGAHRFNIPSTSIVACCKHKPHAYTAGGYIWLYEEEYTKWEMKNEKL